MTSGEAEGFRMIGLPFIGVVCHVWMLYPAVRLGEASPTDGGDGAVAGLGRSARAAHKSAAVADRNEAGGTPALPYEHNKMKTF